MSAPAVLLATVLASWMPWSPMADDEGETSARVLSAEDTLRFASVGSPRFSPDDEWVLYTKSVRDLEDEDLKRTTHVWRVRVGGTDRRQLTHGTDSASSPAWLPSGDQFAFLTSRGEGEGNQVFFMYFDGGEAWQVTEHEGGVSGYSISPDGNKIVLTARDPLSDAEKKKQKQKDDAEVVDGEFRMSHLWLLDLRTGEERRLTEGEFTVSDPQWFPDSTQIAFVTRRTPKIDDAASSDLWLVDLEGEQRKLFENEGPDSAPRWSRDGQTIAFAASRVVGNTQWYQKLHLIPVAGGEPKVLLKDFDRQFGAPIWSRDGSRIYWSTGDGTLVQRFGVEVESGEIVSREAPRRGSNRSFELSHDGASWAFVHSAPQSPSDIYIERADQGVLRLSNANPWLREEGVQLGAVETVKWKNSDGQWIEGVLTRPVGWTEGDRAPLIVNPHGGPSGAVTESFNSTNQFFAGNGFMVIQPNFRGSSNYGQEFLNANRNYWGIRDYDDIMTGVDALIERGLADPDRMVAYGWSYGGYMTFWMCTQTDRFKLISPGAGLSNLYSMYSTTDIPAYLEWFFGTPWDNEEIYRKLSPIRHVKNVTTEILIMHGANDARVPPEQAVEFYKALKDLGKEVTFVRYPRQGHGIREPRLAMDRLRRYLFAFCSALDMTPISDQESDEPEEESEEQHADKAIGEESPDGQLQDRGIFEVVETLDR